MKRLLIIGLFFMQSPLNHAQSFSGDPVRMPVCCYCDLMTTEIVCQGDGGRCSPVSGNYACFQICPDNYPIW